MTTETTTAEQTRATRTAWAVWAGLVAVTLVGGLVTDTDGPGDTLIVVMVLLGLGKTWLIVQYFMEVRDAPPWLQVAVTATVWMLGLWVTLLVLFLRS